jgi:hypothetical protein
MPRRIDEIVSLVNEVAASYQRLVGAFDPAAAGRLKRSAEELRGIFDVIARNADRLVSPTERGQALKAVNDQITIGEGVELHKFFENISTSLIDAQIALDKQSIEYVQQRDPRIPPAYFAIPSVRAEMKLGFSQMSQRGVNMVLFTRGEQRQEYAESTVTFELIATPPPPGSPQAPVPPFLVLAPERERVCDGILEQVRKGPLAKIADDLADEKSRGQAVALRGSVHSDKRTAYLVLWPGPPIGDDRMKWKHFSVFYALANDAGLELSVSIYDKTHAPAEGFLFLPITKQMNDEHADTANLPLTTRLLDTGDVLMNVVVFLNDWLTSTRGRRLE